jgi:OmcA/MtrC family decaheme c-type cytochrome
MSTKSKNRIPLAQRFLFAGLGALALGLAGCSGDNGHVDSAPPPDPDPPPGPGTGAPIPITSAQTIVASITKVAIPADGKPAVEIYLRDERNYPLTGLPAGNIYFVLSRLEPEVNGKSSTWHAITRRSEPCAGLPPPVPPNAPTPPDYVTCTAETPPVNQGYTEAAAAGAWVDNGNGTYRYTFQQSVQGIADIPYDPSLTHRVGLEIRINSSGGTSEPYIPANNALYDLVPALNDRPTAITASGRTIVAQSDCEACHQKLEAHGGGRHEVNYCVMCHESYSYDAQTGNALDFRVMVHKIHMGGDLPSFVATGWPYGIYGFYNFFSDYSGVEYPQIIRNCETCHRENNADAPQGGAWRTTVNVNTCGACHDTVNFATGENHANGVAATDEQCFTCHGPNSGMAGVQTASAHAIPTKIAAGDFKFEIVKIEAIRQDGTPGATPCAAATVACTVLPGEYAKLTIKVTNPRTGATWALDDPPFINGCTPVPPATTCTPNNARVRARVAYTTRNLTNPGTGSADAAQPIQIDFLSSTAAPVGAPAAAGGAPVRNADGTYTKAGATPIPVGLIGGSGVAYIEGRAYPDVDPSPATTTIARVGITASAGVSYPITDATAVPPRQVVDIARCDKCHNRLQVHGDNRNDSTGLCATCHNPGFASGATAATGQPWDFKLLIHALHASTYSYGGETLPAITYPGYLNDCEACHLPGTYYPVDPTVVFATSIDAGASAATPADDTAITPNTAVCASCHTDDTSKQHMRFNGGSFDATKNADGTSPQAAAETCGNCHGAGEDVDVKEVHHVAEFNH